jgi:hypothetical protein
MAAHEEGKCPARHPSQAGHGPAEQATRLHLPFKFEGATPMPVSIGACPFIAKYATWHG